MSTENKSSINIIHPESSISSKGSDGKYVKLAINGAVIVGNGKNLPEDSDKIDGLFPYSGVIRFNETTKKLQFCDGTKWVDLITNKEEIKPSIVYSMIF